MRLLQGREPRPKFIDPLEPGNSHEWFAGRGLSQGLQTGLITLLGNISSPTVVYRMDPKSGFDALEEIEKHQASGNPTFLRMNHVAIHDFVNDSAAIHGSAHIKPHSGGIRIPAGLSYYNKSPVGWFFSKMGVYPANRKIDQIKHLLNTNIFTDIDEAKAFVDQDDINESRSNFNAKLLAGALEKVKEEVSANNSSAKPIQASYPQGTRRSQDEIGELHDDWNRILSHLEDPQSAKIIIFSKSYEGGTFMKRWLTPTIVVDIIDAPHGIADKEEANAELQKRMEEGVELAGRVPRKTVLSPLAKAGLGIMAVTAGAATAAAAYQAKRR